MIKSKGVRCEGSGQEPITMRGAYFYKGKEVRPKEYDAYVRRLGPFDHDLEFIMIPDLNGKQLVCPVCGGGMTESGPMNEHTWGDPALLIR